MGSPVTASHRLMVPSSPEVARDAPSGWKATARTGPSCFRGGARDDPAERSQRRAVRSPDAVASLRPSGQKATAGGAAKKALLGKDKNPSGGFVVTYNRWPLYTYVGDTKPGQANGQATDLNGGLWYVMSPSGKYLTKKN